MSILGAFKIRSSTDGRRQSDAYDRGMNIIAISYWVASAMVLAILSIDCIRTLKNIRIPLANIAFGATIVALVGIAAVGLFIQMIVV